MYQIPIGRFVLELDSAHVIHGSVDIFSRLNVSPILFFTHLPLRLTAISRSPLRTSSSRTESWSMR